jgi:putative membrane-bound dehydrogenase-like protein
MRNYLAFLFLIAASPVFGQREYGFDNSKPSGQPYLKPEESLRRMKVADGFEVGLFAAEPMVINPVAFTVDERGRLWVVECFEYPKRTAKGKMPRDRIVILEDTKGTGVCDKRTVFAEGKDFPFPFDLATGIEVGNSGVYLGAPPYLWFIENKNDKPGKFEVLLKGFGSQDTHETLNTFQWGPDGWLYGLHGVFTYSDVKRDQADGPSTRINAGIWRYHPKTKKFEVFAEGTSNPWGMDWRNTDGEFILCCCVIPHLFHIIPGGIYRRQAGTSFNPYAYGEIKEICDHTFHKESGWAHAGLISLDAPHIPEKYRNSVIFGSIHGCSIKQNILRPNGSTFIASRGDDFLVSGDKNFRPINLRWGPNGEIYVIDWHDQNPCSQAAPDSWDYEHGRVFRIAVKGTPTKKPEDMASLSDERLANIVTNEANPWRYRTALRLLTERWDLFNPQYHPNVPPGIFQSGAEGLQSKNAQKRLRSALLLSTAGQAPDIAQTDPVVRRLNVRDFRPTEKFDSQSLKTLTKAAETETEPTIRREIASSARFLGKDASAIPLFHALMQHKEDAADPVIPFMIWLAYEPAFMTSVKTELDYLTAASLGNPLVVGQIIPRVMRRLIASAKPEHIAAAVAFVSHLKDAETRKKALEGLAEATKGRLYDAPPEWTSLNQSLANDADPEVRRFAGQLAISFRDPAAAKQALATAGDGTKTIQERVEALRALGVLRPDGSLALLISFLKPQTDPSLQVEALRALSGYDSRGISASVIRNWPNYAPTGRAEAANLLATRRDWARELLDAVGKKTIARTDLTDNTILRIRSLNDGDLNKRVEEVWGKFRSTPKELADLIDKMRASLNDGPASFNHGKQVFEQHCTKCHNFEGRGAEVGPHLDGAGRDIEYLLINVLDPNRVIGKPYFVHLVERTNGTSEIGILAAEDDQSITLKVENAVLKVIPKKDIENHTIQEKSMMPEGLAAGMSAQDFRDLIRYVMLNPFINHVKIGDKEMTFGTPGRIAVPESQKPGEITITAEVTSPAETKTKLLLGGLPNLKVALNGKTVYNGIPGAAQPDQAGIDVQLKAGVNRIDIQAATAPTRGAIWARFLDPDRKLRYPESK